MFHENADKHHGLLWSILSLRLLGVNIPGSGKAWTYKCTTGTWKEYMGSPKKTFIVISRLVNLHMYVDGPNEQPLLKLLQQTHGRGIQRLQVLSNTPCHYPLNQLYPTTPEEKYWKSVFVRWQQIVAEKYARCALVHEDVWEDQITSLQPLSWCLTCTGFLGKCSSPISPITCV